MARKSKTSDMGCNATNAVIYAPVTGDPWERIVAQARPQAVILFGSYARGATGSHSDLDVLVIVDDGVANCRAESVRLRRALRGIFMPIDIIVARRSDVERLRDMPGLLYETALREGQVVYERA